MQNVFSDNRGITENTKYLRRTVFSLVVLGLLTIAFTITIIRIQSGAAAYLSGLSIWSRAQVEAVRYSSLYAKSGERQHYEQALAWYQYPINDMYARQALDATPIQLDRAMTGLIKGGNHPKDAPKMILLFRTLKNAPYLRDAIEAWRDSDEPLQSLGDVLQELHKEWEAETIDKDRIKALSLKMSLVNDRLGMHAEEFRIKMAAASRAMSTILAIVTVILFIIIFITATVLVLRLVKSLRQSEKRFRKTFQYAGMGIAQLNLEGSIVEVNEAFCRIFKMTQEQLISQHYLELIQIPDADTDPLFRLVEGENKVSLKSPFICGDGSESQVNVTLSALKDSNKHILQFIFIAEDITEQHRLSKELTKQARHDDLTGLVNRRTFKEYLQDAIKRADDQDHSHCLCFIDLDRFKIVNDTSGHFAGDIVLQQVAKRITGLLRKHDVLARLGGDEFALILDGCDPIHAQKIAEKLKASINDVPFVWQDKAFNVGCCIGMVPITANADLDELMQTADAACYLAKEQGRDKVIMTHLGAEDITARRVQHQWIEKIRTALEEDRFYLDAQKLVPKSSIVPPRIEVLVRMRDEFNQVVSPGEFIPAAERYGLVHLIDRWVIKRVCTYLKTYAEELEEIQAIHINVSGRSFDQKDFIDYTLSLIHQMQIPANKLCFEITETAAVSNISDVYKFMEVLRGEGSTFALDDFGSGLASFSYLRQLPVEYLKIDGSFVQNISNDDVDKAMVAAINKVGHALNKIMVAEFVEDQQAVEILQSMGIEYMQGYHLHKPESFESLMESYR
jgi:diguanylate cyclase (GGDEF)-like protein/PAS domain S-box-containing protein